MWDGRISTHDVDSFSFLPEYGDAQVLSVPQDERDPLVVVGEADVAGQVDAGARQASDLRRVAA